MLVASLSGRKFAPYARRGERASSFGQAGARRAAYRVSQNGAAGIFCVCAWLYSRECSILVKEARIDSLQRSARRYCMYVFVRVRLIVEVCACRVMIALCVVIDMSLCGKLLRVHGCVDYPCFRFMRNDLP